jgi:hypothetical protein
VSEGLVIEPWRSFETSGSGEPLPPAQRGSPAKQLTAAPWAEVERTLLAALGKEPSSEREMSDEAWAAQFRAAFGEEPLETCGRAPGQGQSRPDTRRSPGRPAYRAPSAPMSAEELALSELALDAIPGLPREGRL